MCGSGALIGMAPTSLVLRRILLVLLLALIACIVVAAGSTAPANAVCRFGAATRPTFGATISVCASPFSSSLNVVKVKSQIVLLVRN